MKVLGFDAAVVDDDAAVGEHAVDVEQQQHDIFGLAAKARGNTLHGALAQIPVLRMSWR